jgi:peptidoglycan/LPS O-acetylase OafA/YrhL
MMRLIMVLFNGGAAVSLFFVLSGFVLTLSLHRDSRPLVPKAWAFSRRRFFRIYPTLAINIGVFAIVIAIVASYLPVIPVTTFQPSQIVANLLLEDYPVNGATWSLMIEIVAIPFVFVGYCIARRWGVFGFCVLVVLGLIILGLREIEWAIF